jgi:hypothetical protein
MNKSQYISALRELADYLESREFPETFTNNFSWDEKSGGYPTVSLSMWTKSKSDLGLIAKAMGKFEKENSSTYIGAKTTLPLGAKISIDASKEYTCEKVKVGTRIVPAKEE